MKLKAILKVAAKAEPVQVSTEGCFLVIQHGLKIDSKAVDNLVGMIPYKLQLGSTTDLVDTNQGDPNSIREQRDAYWFSLTH